MYAKELRNKTKEELNEQVKTLEKEIKEIIDNIIKGKEKNIMKTGKVRKDIARIKTVLKEQSLNKEKNA
jgi:large subunit ribosomal protein L29